MNIALLLSGGMGLRLGAEIPKQYIEVAGKAIICYCIEQLSNHEKIDAIQIVADSTWQGQIKVWLEQYDTKKKFRGFSKQGENRQLSILHGLEDIQMYAKEKDWVLIHDAARPRLSCELIAECLKAAEGHDGVLPVLSMKDTVYLSTDSRHISSLLNRDEVFAGQAPEVFCLGKYYEANKKLLPDKILEINGSTEPAILAGLDIVMIRGDENNFKITTKSDLERFQKIVAEEKVDNESMGIISKK